MEAYRDEKILLDVFEVGAFMVNSYIVACYETKIAAIVDPGDEGEMLLNRCKELDLSPKFIFNTHGHIDHMADNAYVKQNTNAKILIHPLDAPMLTDAILNMSALIGEPRTSPPADLFFKEGDDFHLGNLIFSVLHVPGHTRGSVCLVCYPITIVGDVLFQGSIGRTDFPGGSYDQLVSNIQLKLLPLSDDLLVFSGHGPSTTIGEERKHNPFLNDAFG